MLMKVTSSIAIVEVNFKDVTERKYDKGPAIAMDNKVHDQRSLDADAFCNESVATIRNAQLVPNSSATTAKSTTIEKCGRARFAII